MQFTPFPCNAAKNDNLAPAAQTIKENEKENEITKQIVTTTLPPPPEENNNYFIAPNTAVEKQAAASPAEPVVAPPDNNAAAIQLQPAIKVEIAPENEKKVPEAEIFTDAEFPGGKPRLVNFLRQKLLYPDAAAAATEESKEGVSTVKITIDKIGKIKGIEILNSLGAEFDMEIKRVVGRMPQWVPAKKNGEAVESTYNFRVNFKNTNKLQQK
jgi:TonB family protein